MKSSRGIWFSLLGATALALAACSSGEEAATNTPGASATSTTGSGSSGNGKAVFGVSDAAADMGAVTEVKVTIDSVKVHQKGGAWVTVASDAKTFNLLELEANGATEVVGQADLKAGSYDQMEINITKVVVVDANGEAEAELPNSTMQFATVMEVTAGATATADLDFQTDQSLHVSAEGKYVLAPVIAVETRASATAQVAADGVVTITGGRVTSDTQVGMDVQGNVGAGLMISPSAVLSVTGDVIVQTKGEVILGGTIKAVDTAKGTITIESSNSTQTVVNAGSNATINLGGGVTSLTSLSTKVGSEAVVKYDAESKAATTVTGSASGSAGGSANTEATVSGTIKAVDAAAGTITVAAQGGGDVVLKVASDGMVKVDGSASTVATLATKVGSQVTASYNAETKIATSVDAKAQANASGTATVNGTLKAVDVLAGTVTIAAQGGGDVVLKVASNTTVQAGGAVSTMANLATKIGSQVSASYNVETRAAASITVS